MTKIIVRSFLVLLLLFVKLISGYGQSNCMDSSKFVNSKRINNIIGFVPSKATITNGLAIGYSLSLDEYCAYRDSVRINGLHINISPMQPLIATMTILMATFSLLMPETYEGILKKDTFEFVSAYNNLIVKHKINGTSIGLFELGEDFAVNGFQLTVLYHHMYELNGMSFSLIVSQYKSFTGVMVSGILNKADEAKGLQIGLINTARKMTGVQIGLWNKIGKRGFPIVNMRFNRNKIGEQSSPEKH